LKISLSFALLLQGKILFFCSLDDSDMPFPFALDKYGGYIDHINWENIALSNLGSLEARIKIPLSSISVSNYK